MRTAISVVTITFAHNGRAKPARPKGTNEGGVIGEVGLMCDRSCKTLATHARLAIAVRLGKIMIQ